MMPRGEGSNDLSPARRAVAVVVLLVSLTIVAAAQRDLQRREDSQVHGNKLIWRVVSLNALGALAYFRWGRV
jgi:hypothetical protein